MLLVQIGASPIGQGVFFLISLCISKHLKCLLRQDLDECVENLQSRYEHRGKPACRTGWSAKHQTLFSKWQLSRLEAGDLRKSQVGAQAWELDKKSASGKPAPFPPLMLEWLANQSKKKGQEPCLNSLAYPLNQPSTIK